MDALLGGLGAFMDPTVFISTVVGILAGIVVGLIPGFTVTMGVILVLPFTFGMTPLQGIATMMGVAVGGASGGLISATLLGIPGTPSAVATTFDAHPMARGGQPGRALGLGTWASLFGGIIGWAVLALATPVLADFGLRFGPWELFALVAFSITMIASLSGGSLVKGLIAGLLGMTLATVGLDPVLNIPRFTFANPELESGFDFLPVLIGLFAFSQLMSDLEKRLDRRAARVSLEGIRIPHLEVLRDIWRSKVVLVWSSLVGAWIGVVPAAGGSIANVLAYDQAKKVSRHREKFGTGHHEGVIASEAGNNSVGAGDLVPMLALGIPGDAVTAVMLGALLIHGVQPGPQLMTNPVTTKLAWGVVAGYLIATVLTAAIQLFGMRLFVHLTRVPYHVLVPGILVLAGVGAYVLNNRTFDLGVMLFFGVVGYVLSKHGFELPPFVIGFLLAPLAEINLRRAMQTDADLTTFITRPISALLLGLALLSVAYYFWAGLRRPPRARTEVEHAGPGEGSPRARVG